jgi:hypothetical protein
LWQACRAEGVNIVSAKAIMTVIADRVDGRPLSMPRSLTSPRQLPVIGVRSVSKTDLTSIMIPDTDYDPAPTPPAAVQTAAAPRPLAKTKGGDAKKVEGYAVKEVMRNSSKGPEGEWRLIAAVMLVAVLLGFASRFGRKL